MMDEYTEEPMEMAPVDPRAVLSEIIAADNVADLLEEERLATIASDCLRGYEIDRDSMSDWTKRMEKGIELASLVKEEKTYPFDKAANVKYPLITTAALQFNARAYPAIVPSDQVVKVRIHGKDPQGMKAARAERVSEHMSWQLSSQIEEWEETTDKMLTILPIVGTVVRKVWFDPAEGRARCRLVEPAGFIVNNRVKTLSDAPRISEELPLFPDEIASRRRSGMFRDVEYVEKEGEDTHAVQDFIEQHCRLDLDEDGYEEPYIVTLHKKSQKVARIVADFTEEDVVFGPNGVVNIRRGSYYVPYHFLTSMDGGFFSTGFGLLLGDMSESINSIINMMLDAGHMASRGGGFIGSEFRVKGGSQQFKPGEWKMVAARGGDIKNALVPITFPGPDATLFNLLGLMIDAAKDVSAVKDVLTGDTGGRAQTATTTLALIEQGMAQFTAAYKRIFRSLKQEFKILARINAQTVGPDEYQRFHDYPVPPPPQSVEEMMAYQQAMQMVPTPQGDYGAEDLDIEPVADPAAVTKMQEAAKAQFLMQLAEAGMVDRAEASKRMLQAAAISDHEALMPQPDPMAQQMQAIAGQMAQADATLKMIEVDKALVEIEKTRSEIVKNMTDAAATEFEMRISTVRQMLEATKIGLEQVLGRGAGGMAGAPGNGGYGPRPQGDFGPAAGSGDLGLLVGRPVVGGGPAGVSPSPLPVGGPF